MNPALHSDSALLYRGVASVSLALTIARGDDKSLGVP